MNEITNETVTAVYKKGALIAIIKRDVATRKVLTYMVKDARVEDIEKLIVSKPTEDEAV